LKILGPFHLHEEVHAANDILVYYATDTRTGERKLIYLIDQESEQGPVQVQRLVETAAATGQLQHPNILSCDEWGEIDGYHFAATQPLIGLSLAHELGQHGARLSFEAVCLVVQQVADALDFAAEQGALHGALSPANIWLNRRGIVQLSGVGMGALLSVPTAPLASATGRGDGDETPEITPYMAPEQLLPDGVIDRRTDVYGLSAVAYTLLVGRPPFRGEGRTLWEQITHQPPPPLEQHAPHAPKLVGTIIQFGLAKEPASRYATAGEFARAFAQAPLARASIVPAARDGNPSRPWARFGFGSLMRSRYGLRVALPLLFVALLTGGLLISRSFSNASPSPGRSGAQSELALLDETQPGEIHPDEADPIAPSAALVDEASISALPAVDITASASETDGVGSTTEVVGATDVEATEPEVALAPDPSAAEPVAASLLETTEAAAATDEALVEDHSLAPAELEPAGEPVAVTTPHEAIVDATAIPLIMQQWGEVVRLVTGQLLLGAATLSASMPAPDEPAAEVAPSLDPPPVGSPVAGPPPADPPPAEVEEEAPTAPTNDGIHLPLVLQSIYAEGTVNVTANLRAGPSTAYGIMGIAQPGQRVTLVACNANCSWYQLASGEWIAAFLVNLVTEPAQPLPMATPSPPTD
jgi:serine/threonine protein kinase